MNPINNAMSKNPKDVGAMEALFVRRVTMEPRGAEQESFPPSSDVSMVPQRVNSPPTLLYLLHELRAAN